MSGGKARLKAYLWIVAIFIVSSASTGFASEALPRGFDLVAQSDTLALYLSERTLEFAVRDLESDHVWYSNPPGRAQNERVARGANKDMLNAHVILTYFTANRQAQMDSYNDAVKHEQYAIEYIPNGFRFVYEIGRRWQDAQYLPQMISEARFNEEILSKVGRRDQSFVRESFIMFELVEGYVDPEPFSILGVDLEELLGPYGFKVHDDVRAADRRRALQEYLVLVRDARGYTNLRQVTTEDIAGLIDTPTLMLRWDVREWDKEELWDIAKDVGFTPEKAAEEHTRYNIVPPYPDLRRFKVAVEVELDGDSLVVRIPAESVEYPHKVYDPATESEVSYPLTSISLLNYFGASGTDSDGYIFVPDGSGALIRANNGKTTVQPYNARIYGRDYAAAPVEERTTVDLQQAYLPVYGLKDGDKAFLAVVEQGDAMARIEAQVSGMRDSYNKVWASFDYLPQVRVFLDAAGALIHLRRLSLNMYQSRPYRGDMSVRYFFLTGENADYSGMARRYRSYWTERSGARPLAEQGKAQTALDIVGGIDRTRPVLGVASRVVTGLTTFEQARQIADEVYALGVDGVQMRLLGWLKGGVRHIYPEKVRLERSLGDRAALAGLEEELRSRGGALYPSVDFGVVHQNGLFDGFVNFTDASRFLNRNRAYLNTHNPATYQAIAGRSAPLLSPSRYEELIASFVADYRRYSLSGLALGDLGRYLYSDFRVDERDLVDRQAALEIVRGQAARLQDEGLSLGAAGGNAYLLPYVAIVFDAPMESRGFELLDVSVPFYPIALSGYVAYAAPAINLAGTTARTYALRLLETGAMPSFAVAYAAPSEVKHTPSNHLYSIGFESQRASVEQLFEVYGDALRAVSGRPIERHECVTADLCRTDYAGGLRVWVNYGDERVQLDGVTIAAGGFSVRGNSFEVAESGVRP